MPRISIRIDTRAAGWELCLKLRGVTIALLVDVITYGFEVVAAFVSPNIHSIFQCQQRRHGVTSDYGDSHQPGEEVPRCDMISETLFSVEVLRRVEVEVGFVRRFRVGLIVIWRAGEGGNQGLLDQWPTTRVEKKVVGDAE
jgi:hypothetical protein